MQKFSDNIIGSTPTGSNPKQINPQQISGVRITQQKSQHGSMVYISNNPQSKSYLEIDEYNYFLWSKMDGKHTIANIVEEYYKNFGSLPVEKFSNLLSMLKEANLLEVDNPDILNTGKMNIPEKTFLSHLMKMSEEAFQKEFILKRTDEFIEIAYRGFGWFFFTMLGQFILALIVVIGMAWYLYTELFVVNAHHPFNMISRPGSYGVSIIMILLFIYVMLFFHELGHAITCKHYGCRVRKSGLAFYYGMPVFFVDTTNIWMSGKKERILVSLAGPYVSLVFACFYTAIAQFLPQSIFTQAIYQSAHICFIVVLLNMNPLLEFDGYYILTDVLDIPMLRKKSFLFIKKNLLRKIYKKEKFSREEIVYSVFGSLAFIFTIVVVLLVINMLGNEIKVMVRDLLLRRGLFKDILMSGLVVVAGCSLVLGLVDKILVWLISIKDRKKLYSKTIML